MTINGHLSIPCISFGLYTTHTTKMISVFVTLPYLPLVFRHLNSVSYFYLKFEQVQFTTTVVSKLAVLMTNSVDPDESTLFAQYNI